MSTLKRTAVSEISALALLLALGSANAGEQGFYVGLGAGQATLELPEDPDYSFDESETAYKVFGGYNWDLGTINLGIEAAYANLGEPEIGDSTAFLGFETTGFQAWGLAAFELGAVDLYGKLGVFAWDVEARIGGTDVDPELRFTDSDSDVDVGYGLGGRWNLGRFAIRLELEGFDIPDTSNIYMWTLGASYTF